MDEILQHPFAPVVNAESCILILGSFPSVKSRENQFYYGHPQNRFWRMLATAFHEPVPQTIPEKQTLLLAHHLALWDVIASCQITGSSDASVRNAVPVDIVRVLDTASIKRVLCNGVLSGRLYHQYLEKKVGMAAVVLPSTSPANAAWTLDKLLEAWQPHLFLI